MNKKNKIDLNTQKEIHSLYNKIEQEEQAENNRIKIDVLIIEDHPLVADTYLRQLEFVEAETNFIFTSHIALDVKEAFYRLESQSYDIIFLDLNLKQSRFESNYAGEEIVEWMHKHLQTIPKIIVSTAFADVHRVRSVFKRIQPNAFMTKSDQTISVLRNAIDAILENKTYYSETISKMMALNFVNDRIIDDIDIQILYEMSIYTPMTEMDKKIPASIRKIQARKKELKQLLEAEDDRTLIQKAFERGYI